MDIEKHVGRAVYQDLSGSRRWSFLSLVEGSVAVQSQVPHVGLSACSADHSDSSGVQTRLE